MIQSMTGFGKAMAEFEGKKIHVEIRSLNSKTLDLSTRIAPLYREKEMELRAQISKAVVRGKVDLSIWIEQDAAAEQARINPAVILGYYDQIKLLTRMVPLHEPADMLATLLRLPGVLEQTESTELDADEWTAVQTAVGQALDALVAFRVQEGAALERKFTEKIDNIESLLASIEPYEKSRVEKIRQRIVDGLEALPEANYDAGRLEQELIYYIEKLDISEEKQRLTNHLAYFRRTLADETAQGKKLGFIAQEMGREINTTGSKSNLAEMQNIVVKMKDELEQIKEQVLNVL